MVFIAVKISLVLGERECLFETNKGASQYHNLEIFYFKLDCIHKEPTCLLMRHLVVFRFHFGRRDVISGDVIIKVFGLDVNISTCTFNIVQWVSFLRGIAYYCAF